MSADAGRVRPRANSEPGAQEAESMTLSRSAAGNLT